MRKDFSVGRMIRRNLSDDMGVAELSDGAARLYFHLIPHLDSWGKFSGGPGTISETVVPLLGMSRRRILSYLVEINTHTSMRVWTHLGRFFVHDQSFFETQIIREERRSRDILPSYPGEDRMKSGTSRYSLPEYVPDLVPREVKGLSLSSSLSSNTRGRESARGKGITNDEGTSVQNKDESKDKALFMGDQKVKDEGNGKDNGVDVSEEAKEAQAILERKRQEAGINPDGRGRA